MKKIIIALLVVITISCKQNKKTSAPALTGKWIVTELPAENLKEEELEKEIGKASIEFTADGRYTTIDSEETEKGTYVYDEKTSRLIIIAPGNDTTRVEVVFKGKTLILTGEEGKVVLKKAD
ncbi:MAG: hypothetical protein NTW29_20535 [Bacteroidetes bacterium]|nr:hypothetical protein [Bacteroidota bacterium]